MKFPSWRHRQRGDDLKNEIESHLEMAACDRAERGELRDEAQHASHREFGNVDLVREVTREQWGGRWLENVVQDARYGARVLSRAPGFTLAAVLTLALGIGANSTIFSWINATLLSPIPGVADSSGIVSIASGTPQDPAPISYPDYMDLRDRNHTLSGLMSFALRDMGLTGHGKPERVWGMFVSSNYFDVLGVRPLLGRGFVSGKGETPNSAPVVVISYRLWQDRFGGKPSLLGQSIEINHHPFTIVGVTPPMFRGTQTGLRANLWIPVTLEQQIIPGETFLQSRGTGWLIPMGRLKPAVTQAQAAADLSVLMQQLATQFPAEHKAGHTLTLAPLWRAPFGANYYMSTILLLLMSIAGVVLLLTCANVANLMLVRSVSRRREVAIRLSMGATRGRLIRQFLIESLLVALGGGGIAALFTLWTAGLLSEFIPPTGLPVSISAGMNGPVSLVTLLISILTGVIFGILPALRASKLQLVDAFKDDSGNIAGGVRKARLSGALVVVQVALSLLLLICSGLFIQSFRRAQHFDPGFNPHHVLLESYAFFNSGTDPGPNPEFHRKLLERLEGLPGVQAAALADWVPLSLNENSTDVAPEGYVPRSHEAMVVGYTSISPHYFQTMEIHLVAGRDFAVADNLASPLVAIVNRAFAAGYWDGQNPLGKKFKAFGKLFEVIGVAENGNYGELNERPRGLAYFPIFQGHNAGAIIHVRVAGNPLAYASAVEGAVHQLDPELPLFDLTTLDSIMELNTVTQRLAGIFVGAFGFLALLLAAVGVYAVIAYVTRQRTHEIGIRMALGADPGDIFKMVLRHGLLLVILGVTLGLAASFAMTPVFSSELFGITSTDPVTFAGFTVILFLVALLACFLPARRAMRVDPMVALRYE